MELRILIPRTPTEFIILVCFCLLVSGILFAKTRKNRLKTIGLVILILLFSSPIWLESYDDYVDKVTHPSWNGYETYPEYNGARYNFWVDREFPISKITMTANSTSRAFSRTVSLSTEYYSEANIGGTTWWAVEEIRYAPDIYEKVTFYIEWHVLNYTITYEDWTWEYWNGTGWVEELAWFYEFHDYECVLNTAINDLPRERYYCEQYNVTLHYDWWGFI